MTFIPGMAGVADSAGEIIPPLTGVTTTVTQSGSNVIAWPSVLKGDVAVLLDNGQSIVSGAPDVPDQVVPTGFTGATFDTDFYTIASGVTFSQRCAAAYKLCTGLETGNITGIDGVSYENKFLYIIRGDNRAIRFVNSSVWKHGFGGNPAAQNIDASEGGAFPKVLFGMVAGYETDFSTSPNFNQVQSRQNDYPGGGLANFRARAGRTIYNPGDSLIDISVDTSNRGIVLSGLLWFQ